MKRKTNEQYKNDLLLVNKNIINIEPYITAIQPIKHKCLICNNIWDAIPNNILQGKGCGVCSGQSVLVGYNDMQTTNPKMASWLLNIEDGYKYTKSSGIKLNWKCPNCGNIIKNKAPYTVLKWGVSCNLCCDSISTPNRFIANILDSININYQSEKVFDWSNNKRYDIFIYPDTIIEMHGGGHYLNNFTHMTHVPLEDVKENDSYKLHVAKENGITNYIIIDAKYSEFEYMKKNILNSNLINLIDLSIVDWEKCYSDSQKSLLIEACKQWEEGINATSIKNNLKLSLGAVYTYLRRGNEIGLCKYSGINNAPKKVICIDTGEIFKSINSTSKEKDIPRTQLTYMCNKKGKSKICDRAKNKQRFMYYNDYLLNNGGGCYA